MSFYIGSVWFNFNEAFSSKTNNQTDLVGLPILIIEHTFTTYENQTIYFGLDWFRSVWLVLQFSLTTIVIIYMNLLLRVSILIG